MIEFLDLGKVNGRFRSEIDGNIRSVSGINRLKFLATIALTSRLSWVLTASACWQCGRNVYHGGMMAITASSSLTSPEVGQPEKPGVAQNLKNVPALGANDAIEGKDLAARGAVLTRALRSIEGLFAACKNFGAHACTAVTTLAQRSAMPVALAAALACAPIGGALPYFQAVGMACLSKFSTRLAAYTLGSFALNLVSGYRVDTYVCKTLKFLVKLVKLSIIPVALSAILARFGGDLNFLVPNLFAKAGLSNLVAKLATSYVAKFAIMASFGTLLNAASGLVNTCVLGAMKLGSYAYLMAKIALIRTFPLVLTVGLPLILYYCHMLFGSTAVLISLANTILFAIDNCFGQTTFGRLPLRVFQGALTIAEIPFRLIYSLLRAKKFSDVIGILKSELASIPGNKLRILQRQQIQFQGLEAAKLNDGEMADVKAALAIAGASRGEDGEDHERLKSALNKRGLTLIDSLEASGGDNLTESSHGALARFLDNLKLNKNFYFLNGIITTDSGMQATVAYDPAAKVLRIFYHGTDFKPTCRGVKTIAADVQIVFSTSAAKKMADDATRLLELARDAFGDDKCRAVGHSLGGGLCQIACARTKVRGISINPAPVNEDFFARLNADNLKFAQDECIQISLQGDVLSNALVTRNGGCVQLFGRKINFPYSGFDNQHEAAVAEEALNQILLMEQNRALSDSERLEELNERISLLENRISEARGEMQRLNTLTNIRDRNNRQRQLQAEITNHENMLQSLTQERNRIERAARKAIGDVEVQLNKWHQNLARSIRESIDGDES